MRSRARFERRSRRLGPDNASRASHGDRGLGLRLRVPGERQRERGDILKSQLEKKPVLPPVQNEADNGLPNTRGTVAMARTSDPHSATAQFFVNVADNPALDHQTKQGPGWGYAVFGRVIEGMDVVDAIKAVKTGPAGPFAKDAPVEPVVIQHVRRR